MFEVNILELNRSTRVLEINRVLFPNLPRRSTYLSSIPTVPKNSLPISKTTCLYSDKLSSVIADVNAIPDCKRRLGEVKTKIDSNTQKDVVNIINLGDLLLCRVIVFFIYS
jgi:hypothetical protein